MKKLYFLLGGALMVTSLSAQLSVESTVQAKSKSESVKGVSIHTNRAPGDVIGSVYDFSTAANWTIDNTGTSGGGWVIGPNGPTGGFSGGMGEIMSTSGGDFAMYDADGTTGTAYITMSTPIDLSAEGNVAFTFESYYRNFQGSAYFEISTDGGTTWTSFEVHATLPLNESTANPEYVSVNISGVAANQASVLARFRYDSSDDYAWMVDDVAFVEGYDDELILGDVFLSSGPEMLDYYQIPTNLLQDFTFGARISNGGLNDQNNTILNVVANDGSTNIYDENSTPTTVNAFSNDSLEITTPFSAPGNGQYDITYDLSSDANDQNPANNIKVLETITVGGDVYARDNGVVTGSVGYLGSTPIATRMGQYFEFSDEFLIGSVEVGISSGSSESELVYVELRKYNTTTEEFEYIANSDDYLLQTGDLGSIITLDIENGGYNAQPGDIIEVLAGHYGSSDVRIQTAQIGIGAVIYNDQQRSAQNSLFIVRPVRGFVGVEENEVSLSGAYVYPNPAENEFNIHFNMSKNSDVRIQVRDIAGKTVSTQTLNSLEKGEHNLNYNASELNAGMYTVTIESNGSTVNKKVIVK